ncbi:MAG: hypothetical protein WA421_01745 [Nitrososphaeraceae archaeon]
MSRTSEAVGMFGSTPSMFSSSKSNNGSSLKYYCISCEAEHKVCPKCVSKMKKVGF